MARRVYTLLMHPRYRPGHLSCVPKLPLAPLQCRWGLLSHLRQILLLA